MWRPVEEAVSSTTTHHAPQLFTLEYFQRLKKHIQIVQFNPLTHPPPNFFNIYIYIKICKRICAVSSPTAITREEKRCNKHFVQFLDFTVQFYQSGHRQTSIYPQTGEWHTQGHDHVGMGRRHKTIQMLNETAHRLKKQGNLERVQQYV